MTIITFTDIEFTIKKNILIYFLKHVNTLIIKIKNKIFIKIITYSIKNKN